VRLLLAALLVLPLAALAGCRNNDAPAEAAADETVAPAIPFRLDGSLRFLRADGTPITGLSIEIADTDSARTRGLMERDSIPEQVGMLFLMPSADAHSFWMLNTPHALDIFFVGADSVVINVAKYTTPYSATPVSAEGPAQFVVETVAGFADMHGIAPGDRITWSRNGNATAAYVGGLPGGPPAPPTTDAPAAAAAEPAVPADSGAASPE